VTPARVGLAALALLLAGGALADRPREYRRPVPLPQAPSSLPPPPWAAYGAAAYGWPAVGLVVVNPDPGLPVHRWRNPDFGTGDDRRSSPPYRDDLDPDASAALPPVRW